MGKGTNREKPNGAGFTKKGRDKVRSSRSQMLHKQTKPLNAAELDLCEAVVNFLMARHRERQE